MKFIIKTYLIQTLICLIYTNLIISNPIDTNIDKRSIGTYAKSIGDFLFTKKIERNVHYNGIKSLDIYYSKNENENENDIQIANKPVVIYIYGGIWFLGEKSLYSRLGNFLNENGFVGVIPNYVQFPYGNLDDMIYDIGKALHWVYDNIAEYGGDNKNMIMLGHSSGAHLTALGLFKSTLKLKDYNSVTTMQYPPIKKAVLLAGPYDFDVYSYHSMKDGVTTENSKFEDFASAVLGSDQSCPTDVLKEYADKSIPYLGAEYFTLVQITNDEFVPASSTPGLYEQMIRSSNASVEIYVADGFNHCGITEGVMEHEERAENVLLSLLSN
eukprot:jgi/Orpsp1_1/1192344/evm.model.d7180000092445.1